uniref:Retrovirus-related Pol polyprotein from transposon TNT 1-94 n=1 Tax=Rhizophora mucronata TaxID=61149 RepID=A0A2P2J107_RHIMU
MSFLWKNFIFSFIATNYLDESTPENASKYVDDSSFSLVSCATEIA